MIKQGLEEEVKALVKLYEWKTEPLKGIGYVEWREYFESTQDMTITRERIINSTMNLAKRQRTWFKRNKGIQWITDPSKSVDIVTTFLNKSH
jgi:tRNA dimethylallyltransferase